MRVFITAALFLLFSAVSRADLCQDVFPAGVTSNSSAQLNVPTWSSSDHILATFGSDTFAPGDHEKASGQLSGTYDLNSSGVTARLYFTSLSISGNVDLNPGGDPEDLIIVVDGPITISGTPTINAILYATGDITFSGTTFTMTGAVTSESSITIDDPNLVTYDSDAIKNADFGDLCLSPTAYWSFDTIVNFDVPDDSGNGHNGTLGENGVGEGDEPTGQCGKYLEFDGTDDFVNVVDDNELDITQELTVAIWIRPERYPSSGLMTILSKDENYEFHVRPSGRINWWWRNSSGGTRQFDSASSVPLDQWTHVAIVYSRTDGTQTIYINGVADATRNFTNEDLQTNSDPLQIGNDQFFSGRYFFGDLDEVYLFEKALSQAQVQELMNTSAGFCGTDDALAYYTFDQETWNGTAGEVVDGSGNGADGTTFNGTLNLEAAPARPGSPGTCQYGGFDGQNDYIATADSSSLLQISGDYSTSVWVYGSALADQNRWAGIYTKTNPSGSTNHWNLQRSNLNDSLIVYHGGSAWTTGITVSNISEGWHHISITYSGSTITSYLDGVLVRSNTFNSSPVSGDGHLNIGADRTQSGNFVWNGRIDELFIFERALSATEVSEMYAQTRPCQFSSSCLFEYKDEFSVVSYTNSDGTSDWSGNAWVETNDDGSPGSGLIQITGGELEITGAGGAAREIERSVDLSSALSAQLSFDFRESGSESNDLLRLWMYDGSSWSLLATFTGSTPASSQSFDISAYLNADTRVRFVEEASNATDKFYIDNLSITGSCIASTVDHLEVLVSTTSASTCVPLEVTIVACEDASSPCTDLAENYDEQVSLSVSSDRGTWAKSNADGTLTETVADDGDAMYQFVTSDAGDAVLTLDYKYADAVQITVEDTTNSLTATSSVVTFSDNAFLVEWTDNIHTGSSTANTIAVAGRNHDLQLSYIRKDTVTSNCGVVTEYTGAQNLKAWYTDAGAYTVSPAAPGVLSDLTTLTPLPSSEPGSANLPVTFSSGIASLDLTTSDVGQFTLSFKDVSGFAHDANDPPNAIPIIGSSSTASVRPFGVSLDVMADASTAGCSTQGSRAQNATGSSYATDHNGSTYLTAGSDFDLVVRAVLWETGDDNNVVGGDGVPDSEGLLYNNSCTGSFGKENTPETVTVSLSNFRPTSGSSGQLGGAASQVISGFNNGFSYITMDYDEVGIVDLAGALTSASYLGAGVNVTGTLNNLGRFYPHYFSVTPNTPELNDATGWACDFTYQGQQFDFFTDVVLTVQAREADGEVTEKYDGDYYKLDAPDPSVTFSNSASGAVAVLTDHSASPSVSVTDQNDYDGETLMTFSGYLLAYEKAAAQPVAQDAPFQAVINWILPAAELTDTDGACVNNPASCADVTVADISGTEVRYGRAVVTNNSGSELMPLELGLRTEYWDEVFAASGRYAFSVHTDDTCSDDVWSDTDLTLSQFTGNLSDGSPGDVDVSLGTFDAGAGDILLANPSNSNQGPGAGNEGSVNVTLDVDDWLKYDFFGRGVENPVGTGTFGVYSGRQPVFYMRESYR